MAKIDGTREYPPLKVVVCGGPRSGKSVLAALVFKRLREAGLDVTWEDVDLDEKRMQEYLAHTSGNANWVPKGKITITSEQTPRGG